MKKIELSRGMTAFVDDEDYIKLIQFKWRAYKPRNVFYAKTNTPRENGIRKTITMHQVILNFPKNGIIDHIDGDGLNNQKSNLRLTTNRVNQQNQHRKKSSRYPGVSRNKKRWRSYIQINGIIKYLGSFESEYAAYQKYMESVPS